MPPPAEAHELKRQRMSHIWMGAGLLLIITIGIALMGRGEPMTQARALLMAATCSAGLLAMGWLMARVTPYPRWALYVTSVVMALSMVMSVFVAQSPAAWQEETQPSVWMLPWFLLMLGTLSPSRAAACAPASPRSGWIMVATGTVLTALLVWAPFLVKIALRTGQIR